MLLSIIGRDWFSGMALLDKHMTYIVHVIVLIYKKQAYFMRTRRLHNTYTCLMQYATLFDEV